MDYQKVVLEKIEMKDSNKKKLRTGTLLISSGREERVKKWDFRIFHPLDEKFIKEFEEKYINLPKVYKDFLKKCNGLFLFDGEFYLYGKGFLEKGMTREEQIYQPYDINEENGDPPIPIDENVFYFGGTPQSIFVFEKNGNISEISRRSKKKLESFPDFDTFLVNKLETNLSKKKV